MTSISEEPTRSILRLRLDGAWTAEEMGQFYLSLVRLYNFRLRMPVPGLKKSYARSRKLVPLPVGGIAATPIPDIAAQTAAVASGQSLMSKRRASRRRSRPAAQTMQPFQHIGGVAASPPFGVPPVAMGVDGMSLGTSSVAAHDRYCRQLRDINDTLMAPTPENPGYRMTVIKISYGSPGITDFLGVGQIITALKDIICKLIDWKIHGKDPDIERQRGRLELLKQEVNIIQEWIAVYSSLGYSHQEIKELLPWLTKQFAPLSAVINSGKLVSAELSMTA